MYLDSNGDSVNVVFGEPLLQLVQVALDLFERMIIVKI